MIETLRELLEGIEVADSLTLAGYFPDALLDALIYRSCPECGGSRKCQRCGGHGEYQYQHAVLGGGDCPKDVGEPYPVKCDDCKGTGICPACADSPVAIVEAALRERARDALWAQEDTRDLISAELWLDAAVDAVLSTVLGRPVRYAKEAGYLTYERDSVGAPIPMLVGGKGDVIAKLKGTPLVAILEEAGKEE